MQKLYYVMIGVMSFGGANLVFQFRKVYIEQSNIQFYYLIYVFHMIMPQEIKLRNF